MTYTQLSAVLGFVMGLCFIFLRHRISRYIVRTTKKSLKGKEFELFKQLKKNKLEGKTSKFIEFQMVFMGAIIILMYIPTFFPQSRRVIYIIVEFFVFSFFSIAASALIMGTLLRGFLFKETERYNCERETLQMFTHNRRTENCPEKHNIEAESRQQKDPTLQALQKKELIKAIICFVILYIIFLSSFFTLVSVVK